MEWFFRNLWIGFIVVQCVKGVAILALLGSAIGFVIMMLVDLPVPD